MLSTSEPIRVFWAPGCSSCLRTKEFLNRRGVPFESVNVKDDTVAMERLLSLGARSVPIVSRGDRFVYAQSLEDIVRFLGLDQEAETRLSPPVLVERLDGVLAAAERYLHQVPAEAMDVVFRSFFSPRALGQHVFRVTEAFVEAASLPCEYTYELMMRGTHAVMPGDDIPAYGRDVARRFQSWWDENPDRSCGGRMAAYWGEQSVHEILERTAWHSAQHTRQLLTVLDAFGVEPDGRLTDADLQGLPLPESVWGESETRAKEAA